MKNERPLKILLLLALLLSLLLIIRACAIFALGAAYTIYTHEPATAVTSTQQTIIINPPLPSPTATATAITIVEERLDLTPLYGAGEVIFVRVPTHYITAVGISYPHGDNITQQTICEPVPSDGMCQFPRPVLSVLEARGFSLMVRDANSWHYLPANVSNNVLTVIWGHHNGVYRYHVE